MRGVVKAHSGAKAPLHTQSAAGDAVLAWLTYLRTGDASGLPATGESSGHVAPPQTEALIARRMAGASPMREIATVRSVGAGAFRKPVAVDLDPATLSLLEFPAADLYACPAATQSLLDDAALDLDEWLAAEVEDAFAAQETAAFVTGDGANSPKGFLSYEIVPDADHEWGKVGAVQADPADLVSSLIDLIYAPSPKYRAGGRFVMNRRTTNAIKKLRDADGNYVWSPATQPGATSSLLGYPVTELDAMPDMGPGAPAIAFGDFRRAYLIVDRSQTQVLRDPYSAKPYVLFYTTKRVGGGVQDFDAVKVLALPPVQGAAQLDEAVAD